MDGADDLEISPEVGKVVIFDPVLRHGVHENRSGSERISFAFNLFPFPFPTEEI
jgi:ectoine hydroxylase-related dioxygenase (phytanoyl-CoA dioxygenase family)